MQKNSTFMLSINIKETQNPAILKFEFPDFITRTEQEFKNIDEARHSPLAKQLFHLPFVKTVFISGNFVAIERYNIIEWPDVQADVAEQIENFVNSGGQILTEQPSAKKIPVTIYGEVTPNPSAMKFVANIRLTKTPAEYKNIDESVSSPLAQALFNFPYVREIYINENYVSVTKYDVYNWDDITLEVRSFIKQFIENGGVVIDHEQLVATPANDRQVNNNFESLDPTSQQIINILEQYVRPAVAADGGNILFDSYDETEKRVKVVLQGACNGCPSSTFTLKSGIENMLKDMLNDEDIKVEAVNG